MDPREVRICIEIMSPIKVSIFFVKNSRCNTCRMSYF